MKKPSILIIDRNKDLISAVRKAIKPLKMANVTAKVGDAIAYVKTHKNSVIASASNPSFGMEGGLDAQIKTLFPDECKRVKKKNWNQRIGRVLFTVTVNNAREADTDLILRAVRFALLNVKPGETLVLTGLGTGIGSMLAETFAEILSRELANAATFWGKPTYKVLVDGASCHGGSLKWSLPKKHAGDWQRISGNISICNTGLHGTTSPYEKWMKFGASIYECEVEDVYNWDENDKKFVARAVRLVREVPHPDWWMMVERFIREELPSVRFFNPTIPPKKEWRVFTGKTLDAAWNAAWNAARDTAWDAARDAARGAARGAALDAAGFVTSQYVCADLKLVKKHKKLLADIWEVWTSGYGLAAEVNGVLYVYAKEDMVPTK
jgi:hypothetical protein